MMATGIELTAESKAKLLYLLTMFPRETYRGLGRSASIIRGKLRKIMRKAGGVEGVDKFEPHNALTALLHPGREIGGMLAKSHAIQMYKNGKDAFTIGFISPLKKYAMNLQTSEKRPMERAERSMLYRKRVEKPLPDYDRPARDVIQSFTHRYSREFVQWTIRNTEKILQKAG
jgi:hypothetical protein